MHQGTILLMHPSDENAADATGDDNKFAACHRVFDVPELAESIFLQLDLYDITWTILCTCRSWKAIVDNSMKLQRLLFYRPISSTRLHYFGDFRQNQEDDETGRWSTSDQDPGIYKIYPHPFLSVMYRDTRDLNWEAIRRPEASWRRALATQPPTTEIGFQWDWYVAQNDAGVTLQDLVPGGFASPQGPDSAPNSDTRFNTECIDGEQEFEESYEDPPTLYDLQELLARPFKSNKTPIPFCP